MSLFKTKSSEIDKQKAKGAEHQEGGHKPKHKSKYNKYHLTERETSILCDFEDYLRKIQDQGSPDNIIDHILT